MAYDIPKEVLERERLRVKELRSKKKGGRLPNGAAQFVHNGITYTLSANKSARHGLEVKVASKELAKENHRRSVRKNQSIDLTPEQKVRHDQIYDQRSILSEGTGLQHHVDHDNPVKTGGAGNDPDNLQIVKGHLNLKKGAKTSGPEYEAAQRDGVNNGRLFRRMLALGLSREAQVEFIRHRTPKPLPKAESKPKSKPKSKPSRKLRFGSVLGSSSGSEIVDRVNGNMHLTAPHLADLGFEFF